MFLFLAPGLFQQTTSGLHVEDGCPGVLPPSFFPKSCARARNPKPERQSRESKALPQGPANSRPSSGALSIVPQRPYLAPGCLGDQVTYPKRFVGDQDASKAEEALKLGYSWAFFSMMIGLSPCMCPIKP